MFQKWGIEERFNIFQYFDHSKVEQSEQVEQGQFGN